MLNPHEFFTLAVVHFVALVSPGPDFALVLKQSVVQGRRAGVLTALGISLGIFVHVAYTILGLGVLINQSIVLFSLIKFAGAGYLIFIGFQALRSQQAESSTTPSPSVRDRHSALTKGFLTNLLNPKATLFFLAVFSVVVNPLTSLTVQVGYGIWMATVTFVWFAALSYLFSWEVVRSLFLKFGHWFDRVMGILLILLGLRLALMEVGQ